MFSGRNSSQQPGQQPRCNDVDRREAGDNVRIRAGDDGCCDNVHRRGANYDETSRDIPNCDETSGNIPTGDIPTDDDCPKGGHRGLILCASGRKECDFHRCSDGVFGDQGGRNAL